jgi:hypothetical protein
MKNIHLLPTEKPSRLFKFANQMHLDNIPKDYYKKYNIYITSDEEIKEGDWYYWIVTNMRIKAVRDNLGRLPKFGDGSKKIILTTDQDLIADGFQAIDDEFLEWFVKNPSCNNVEVKTVRTKYFGNISYIYKIIIPEEEPKQETLEEAEKEFEKLINGKALPTKQLTEVAEHYFIVGYEIGQEKRYSEEEVIKLLIDCKDRFGGSDLNDYTTDGEVKRWFEQFKKK